MQPAEYALLFSHEEKHWWFRGRRLILSSLLRRFAPAQNSLVYDLGCGTGGHMDWLSEFGKVQGIDASEHALAFCRRRGLSVQQGSVEHLPFANQSADGVALIDVLYHRWVRDNSQALREAHRVLKPGGWLLFNDSALAVLSGGHDEAVMGKTRFHAPEVRTLLEAAGFEVHFLSYWNFFLLPLVFIVRRCLKHDPSKSNVSAVKPWLNSILFFVLRGENLWLRRWRFPAGSSVAAFCTKR